MSKQQHFTAATCKHISQTFAVNNEHPEMTQQVARAMIAAMLGDTGHTFASLVQCTKVLTAAQHKQEHILKMVYGSISIASKLNEFTSLYENAVKRSAAKIVDNDKEDIKEFQSQGNWFHHTDCYSIVKHNTEDKYYLFALYNKVFETQYYNALTHKLMTKEEVAVYLTKSEVKKLLEDSDVVQSVSTGLVHTVHPRVIGLQNVIDLKAVKEQYNA